jgi:hypothetical protein
MLQGAYALLLMLQDGSAHSLFDTTVLHMLHVTGCPALPGVTYLHAYDTCLAGVSALQLQYLSAHAECIQR